MEKFDTLHHLVGAPELDKPSPRKQKPAWKAVPAPVRVSICDLWHIQAPGQNAMVHHHRPETTLPLSRSASREAESPPVRM